MTLSDTGPLVALVDTRQSAAPHCRAALARLPKPLITTWPCFTEAMYLAHRIGGWPMQRLLWRYVETGVLRFYALTDQDVGRMQDLMQQYRNIPMDLADASLVVAAEALNLSQVFTLDTHFHAYRIHGTGAFLLIP